MVEVILWDRENDRYTSGHEFLTVMRGKSGKLAIYCRFKADNLGEYLDALESARVAMLKQANKEVGVDLLPEIWSAK